jgi:hypothetical protein
MLVDVTTMAGEAGFTIPVAITAALHNTIEAIPDRDSAIQSVAGRLWDVLWMAYTAATRSPDTDRTDYTVIVTIDTATTHTLELPPVERTPSLRG